MTALETAPVRPRACSTLMPVGDAAPTVFVPKYNGMPAPSEDALFVGMITKSLDPATGPAANASAKLLPVVMYAVVLVKPRLTWAKPVADTTPVVAHSAT